MASREEQKRRLREERIAAEEAERKKQARAQRMRSVLIGVGALAVLAVAGVLLLGTSQNSGDEPASAAGDGADFVQASVPPMKIENLEEATAAAGCKLRDDREYESEHTTEPVDYETNPPTSGPHDPVPADDGAYAPGNVPPVEPTVHALEHGRINIQWKPGTTPEQIGELKAVFDEQEGYHALLYENQTDMKHAVAATAWGQALTCDEITDETFDAIRAFRARFTDQGPEFVP